MIYNDLALFTAVARHKSFSEAARQTGIPLARVSRRIAALEGHLGIKLLERTTRHVRLTEEGRRLLDQCQDPIEQLEKIIGFSASGGSQTIRMTAPPLAARLTIGPKLLEFADKYPNIAYELTATNANLDFFRDNIDLAFRLGPLRDSNLVARRLWPVPYGFSAAPSLIKRFDLTPPISRERFLSLPAIVSRQSWDLQTGEIAHPRNIVHHFDDLDLIAAAARRGIGVAMLPVDMVTEGLIALTVHATDPAERDMYAVYPSKRLLPQRIRDLIDFLVVKAP